MTNMTKTNVILIGFSNTGKSTVGPMLAQRLGWEFVDTDDLIVAAAGKPIPAIFADDGEDRFRELESQALAQACAGERRVIAAGGGAILDEENRQLMQERCWVVCLEARPDTIYRRLLRDQEQDRPVVRPLLAGPDPLQRITWLKEFRQSYYAIADWTVHTDYLTHEQVVEEVMHGLGYFGVSSA
jgi:shikimate kinase